jgi:hypothetical protein
VNNPGVPPGSHTLGSHSDVDPVVSSGPSDGDFLVYDGAVDNRWEARTIAAGDIQGLALLAQDVGGASDAERTFASASKYTFSGDLEIDGSNLDLGDTTTAGGRIRLFASASGHVWTIDTGGSPYPLTIEYGASERISIAAEGYIRGVDGAVTGPTYSFANATNYGMYYTASQLNWAVNGVQEMYLTGTLLALPTAGISVLGNYDLTFGTASTAGGHIKMYVDTGGNYWYIASYIGLGDRDLEFEYGATKRFKLMTDGRLWLDEIGAPTPNDGDVWLQSDGMYSHTSGGGTAGPFGSGGAHPDPHLLGSGTVGAPTYSFSADSDCGVYYVATGVRVAISGADKFIIGSTFVETVGTANLKVATTRHLQLGDASNVGGYVIMYTNSGTAWYTSHHVSTYDLMFEYGAANLRFQVKTDGRIWLDEISAPGSPLDGDVWLQAGGMYCHTSSGGTVGPFASHPDPHLLGSGSVGAPTYSFSAASTTGVYYSATQLNWAIAGVQTMVLDANRLTVGTTSKTLTYLRLSTTADSLSAIEFEDTGGVVGNIKYDHSSDLMTIMVGGGDELYLTGTEFSPATTMGLHLGSTARRWDDFHLYGPICVGADDNQEGLICVYGGGAGTAGGELRLYLNAAHDASTDYFALQVYEDELRVLGDSTPWFSFKDDGRCWLDEISAPGSPDDGDFWMQAGGMYCHTSSGGTVGPFIDSAGSHPDPHQLGSGSVSAPTYSFSANSDCGMYYSATQLNWAIDGTNELILTATELKPASINGLSLGTETLGWARIWLTGNNPSIGFTNSGFRLRANTSDGSDDAWAFLCGGGQQGSSRGSYIELYGNEYATVGGSLQLNAGNVSSGDILMYTAGALKMTIPYAGTNVVINTGLTCVHSGQGYITVRADVDAFFTVESNVDDGGTEKSGIIFRDTSSLSDIWSIYKDESNDFVIYDHDGFVDALKIVQSGDMTLAPAGGTVSITGLLATTASAAGGAGLNVPHGAAPTSPVNGDIWTTTAGLYVQINGSTVGPLS